MPALLFSFSLKALADQATAVVTGATHGPREREWRRDGTTEEQMCRWEEVCVCACESPGVCVCVC